MSTRTWLTFCFVDGGRELRKADDAVAVSVVVFKPRVRLVGGQHVQAVLGENSREGGHEVRDGDALASAHAVSLAACRLPLLSACG
eukprot:CAMPEP_0171638144 /NCGR_PEP_ID=MMETSP0990-20121206/28724_1 /TAXON_ID=483369 /ORGANISM="non described non described, Strain CCMP2098" /LENGTH=85 /DNA_ID=CAMNT_0012211197 /DNA_START=352 /DNA_END=610 /DNA_ORIENTATION=+